MKAAYVDTSYLVAIAFGEPGSARLVRSLQAYDVLLSSNLLEAELRSALKRENVSPTPENLIADVRWVYPDRPLTAEMSAVLDAGYLRGADLWHLAVALFVDPRREIDFLTLDSRQREISEKLRLGTV